MRKILLHIVIAMFVLVNANSNIFCATNRISNHLVPSVRLSNAYEIGDIQFVGNDHFEDDMLSLMISSKITNRSLPHLVLQSYYNEAKKNRAAPRILVKELNKAIVSLEHELKYFDITTTESDTLSLWNFYNTQGFHYVSISYSFAPDTVRRINVLTFNIDEGKRFSLDTIVYLGLDTVAPEVMTKINSIKSRRETDKFNEMDLIPEIKNVFEVLLNHGYYYATVEKPNVSMDTIAFRDSLSVQFNTGKRVRFGDLTFIDSTNGQHIVTKEMKRRQLDFKEGDWYSRTRVNNSIDNLLSIGTFASVSIDTCSNDRRTADSLLNFCIESSYRKHREWGVALFTNHTQLTNYNAGIEGSISHRNLFGMAQSGTFYSSFAFKDVLRLFESVDNLDYEMQVGARFTQPLLWSVDNSRIGVSGAISYTVRTINNFFQINTFSLPIKFPINLPKKTYFNSMSLDFIFERENPVNFTSAVANALKNENNTNDSLRIIEAFYLYNNLHQYLQEPGLRIWTSNTIGFSLVGDNKDNHFNPTRGTYTFIGFDGWNIFLSHPSISGISRFFRFQFMHSQYFPINNNLVFAAKGRFGFIKLVDAANTYVPIDKQFFAGGSNSVRGWASRTLRYTHITQDSLGSKEAYQYLQNFIGNGGLLEGSIELRYKLSRPRGFSDFIAEQVAALGITAFLDFGNAFHWYLGNENIKMKVTDYLTKLAVSVGLGLRYDTPVGPIRLDFATPIYDPLGKEIAFRKVNFHIGIGHAF